tara:strand:+ start:22 stop:471 length:450 start_codon:yes stop_codon:yes gene_type:complete
LNFFLYINRKLIFFFGLIIFFLFITLIFLKQINLTNNDIKNFETNFSNADISQPKFSINNKSKKIHITAKEGNFLNKDEILLKENVKFKSNNFSIETEKVIFNRSKQTAQSKTKSLFTAKNTKIYSDGFDIHDKGNKIVFYGKSFVVLK